MARVEETSYVRGAKMLLAGYLIVFMLLQLFSFETFPAQLANIGVPGEWSYVVAIALVVLELLSLPYLLGMKLSRTMRHTSKIVCGMALFALTVLEFMGAMAGVSVLLGATFVLPGGAWSITLMLALWMLFVWGVWGNNIVGGNQSKRGAGHAKSTRKEQ